MDDVLLGPLPGVDWVDQTRAERGVTVRVPGWPGMSAGDTVHLAWGTHIIDRVVGPDILERHGVGPVDLWVPPQVVALSGDGHLITAYHVEQADGFRSEWSLPTRTLVVTEEPDAVPGRLLYADGHHVVLDEDIDPGRVRHARLYLPGPFPAGTDIDVAWTGFGPGGALRTTTWHGTAATFTPAADIPAPAGTIAWSAGNFVAFAHTATKPGGRTLRSPGIALLVAPA
ncbi:hypothetical protein [Streptodolium elevatio]|uniref:Uncharacterized protein n=1 Tax=Streptodolium elevatio TaxID=3157996 RepID=A0ABV3DSA0_9ACTN